MPLKFKASERCLLSIKLERDNEPDDDRAGLDELFAAQPLSNTGLSILPVVDVAAIRCAITRELEQPAPPGTISLSQMW